MKVAFSIGILLFVAVVADLTLWISLSTKDISFDQTKALYLSYFPAFLRNATILTLLTIALSSLSIYLLSRSSKLPGTGYRRVGQLLLALNFVLISWQIFSLM